MNRRRAAERVPGVLDDGQTITAGRWLAESARFDPESPPYNVLSGTVDAGVALFTPSTDNFADPAIARGGREVVSLLGGSSTGDFLRTVGGYRGAFRQVDVQRATDFINGEAGSRIVDWLANEDSWEAIFRRSKGQYEPNLVSRLADASDPDEVREILRFGLVNDRSLPAFSSRPGALVGRRTAGWRFAGSMPDRVIDFTDPSQAVNAIDDFAGNVNAPREMRGQWLEAMGRADTESGRRAAYHQVLGDTAEMLMRPIKEGGYQLTPERAQDLTRYIADELDSGRVALDELAG